MHRLGADRVIPELGKCGLLLRLNSLRRGRKAAAERLAEGIAGRLDQAETRAEGHDGYPDNVDGEKEDRREERRGGNAGAGQRLLKSESALSIEVGDRRPMMTLGKQKLNVGQSIDKVATRLLAPTRHTHRQPWLPNMPLRIL